MKEAASDFIARCTPYQRAHGLPPDGERAMIVDDKAFISVPVGKKAGDILRVLIGARYVYEFTVPEDALEGSTICLPIAPRAKLKT